MRFFDFMHLILLNCDIYYTSCIAFCKVIQVSISGLMQSYVGYVCSTKGGIRYGYT